MSFLSRQLMFLLKVTIEMFKSKVLFMIVQETKYFAFMQLPELGLLTGVDGIRKNI